MKTPLTMNQDKNPLPNKYRALLTLMVVIIAISFIFSAASGVYYFSKQSKIIISYTEAQKKFWDNRIAALNFIENKKDTLKAIKGIEAIMPAVINNSNTIYQRDYKKLLEAAKDSSKASIKALKIICDKRIATLDSINSILFANISYRDSLIIEIECLQSSDSLQLSKNLLIMDSLQTANEKALIQLEVAQKKNKSRFWIGLATGVITGEIIKSLFN